MNKSSHTSHTTTMKNSTGKTSELSSSLYLTQQGTREKSGKLRAVEREQEKRPRKSLAKLRIHLGDLDIKFSPFPVSFLRQSQPLQMVCDAARWFFSWGPPWKCLCFHYSGKVCYARYSCRRKLFIHNNLEECHCDSIPWSLRFLNFILSSFP